MQMYWTDEVGAVLRFEAETEAEVDIVGRLWHCGPLTGAKPIFVREADSPWALDTPGCRGFMGGGGLRLLVGLEWDVRNQPAVGYPLSDAEARVARATQSAGQALQQLVSVLHGTQLEGRP